MCSNARTYNKMKSDIHNKKILSDMHHTTTCKIKCTLAIIVVVTVVV